MIYPVPLYARWICQQVGSVLTVGSVTPE